MGGQCIQPVLNIIADVLLLGAVAVGLTMGQVYAESGDNTEEIPASISDTTFTDSAFAGSHETDLMVGDSSVLELNPRTIRGKSLDGRNETAGPTMVSGDQIRSSMRNTYLEELSQQSAGIYVTSRGTGLHGVASGASGGIYMRGLGGSPNSQVLVVEDGVPDYQGIFGHPISDAFVPSLIDRVKVIKGGDGVLYGTNAMGGVIVIKNRWPSGRKTRLASHTAYGSYNTFRESLLLEKGGERLSWYGAGNAFRTDGHRDGTMGGSTAGQAGVRLKLTEDWYLSVRDKLIHLEGGDPGPVTHPKTENWFKVIRNSGHIRLDGYMGGWVLQSSTWMNTGEHRLYDGFHSLDYTGGSKLELSTEVFKRMGFTFGMQGNFIDGSVENRIENEKEKVIPMLEGSTYGQAVFRPANGLQLVVGGRALYSDSYGFVPLYKGGIKWELGDIWTLRTRIVRNFRQPTLRELYLPYPTANSGLRPEYAVNWDGGLEFKWRWLQLACTPYRTWATDLIKYFGSWPSAEVVNIDKIEIWGVDLEARIVRAGPFSLMAAYCRQDVGRYTKQNPDSKANLNLEISYPIKGWRTEFTLGSEWVSGIYMNNYKRDPLDDVFSADMSVKAQRKLKNGLSLAPYLMVRNFLDRRFAYIEGYTMPGIHLQGGLRLNI